MSWLNLSRGAAILALLCFFTPWFAISCQQTEIVSATGLQLATGTVPQPAGGGGARDQGMAIWAVLALLMLLGAVAIMAVYASAKDRLRIACGLCGGAALLLAGGMLMTVDSAKRELVSSRGAASRNVDAAMRDLAAQGIRLEVKFGYWLTLLLASGASATAWFAATGRAPPRWASAGELKSAVASGSVDLSRWTPAALNLTADQRYWDRMPDKSDPDALEEYLTRFPDGQFVGLARTRIVRAGREAPEPPAGLAVGEPVAAPSSAPAMAANGDLVGETGFAEETVAVMETGLGRPAEDAVCPACRAPVPGGARFCTECGHRLAPDAVS